MLKDTIVYGGQTILTIYHENEELDVPDRHWLQRQKIGAYWAIFEERSYCGTEASAIKDESEEILLPYNHPLSPADDHEICVLMRRVRSIQKPSRLFHADGSLRLGHETWEALCGFVKQYTGINAAKSPLIFGDIILFHYIQLRYYETKEGNIAVESIGFDRIDIHFHQQKAICEHQTKTLSPTRRTELQFVPTSDWDTFDIYAYEKNQLYFFAQDVSFIHSIHLAQHLDLPRNAPLKKSDYKPQYTHFGKPSEMTIGQEKSTLRIQQEEREAQILAGLKPAKETSHLILKGSDRKVYQIVNQLLDHPWEDVLLLDPYLLDLDRKQMMMDWMRLLCGSPVKWIHAIYYKKEGTQKAMTIAEACQSISNDWLLNQSFRRNKNKLTFVGLREYIHDRFLLCREGNRYAGLSLGTSVNSLHSNYFCVHNLAPSFAEECWRVFHEVVQANTVESEVIQWTT